jgi:predicted DNA binding protein
VWKECIVCPNYEVSTYGDIRNKTTGKILKQKLDKNNILMVNLSLGARGHAKYFIVARLVAIAFVPNPMGYTWVRHIDGNILNNEASNLEWTKERWSNYTRGEQSYNSKLTKEQVQWCREVYKPRDKEFGLTPLAKRFNVSTSTMFYVLNNVTYK